MDDPLVPESLQGNAKYCVYGGVTSTLLFIAITIIMTVVYGSKKGHPGYYVLALALLGFLISVLVLLNWVRQNTVEEKIKYVVGFQLLLLVLLSIGSLIEILQKDVVCPTCPACPLSPCEQSILSGLSNSICRSGNSPTTNCGPAFSSAPCFTNAGYSLPSNGTLTIALVANPPDEEEEATAFVVARAEAADAAAAAATAAVPLVPASSNAAPVIPVRSAPRGRPIPDGPSPASKRRTAPDSSRPSKGAAA